MAKRKAAEPIAAVKTQAFLPLVGHAPALEKLKQAVRLGRLGHAYLFAGPEGIGKRRLARHVAQALLCEVNSETDFDPCGRCPACVQVAHGSHPDLLEVAKPDGKTDLPIAAIQELVAQLGLKPARGKRKIAIVDDADDLNEESANCFLKTLEEPPPGSLLILIATSAETQLATIQSRCQTLRLDPLTSDQAAKVLAALIPSSSQGGKGEETFPGDLLRVAEAGEGSVGLALELARPEWREFQRTLRLALAAETIENTDLAERSLAFIDEAGKDSAAKRLRARRVIGLAVRFFRDAMVAACGEEAVGDAEAIAMARRQGVDVLADLIDRSLEADVHVARLAQLPLAIETWLDDVSRIAAGEYVGKV